MSRLVRRVAAPFVLLTGMVAAPAGPAGAAVERVQVGGTRFTPARVQIELGDSVIWMAADDGHTVTARDGSFDSSSRGLMREGDQYRWRFRVPGTYAYFCRVHLNQGMQGTVVVVDAATSTSSSRVTPVTAPATTSSTAPTTATAPPATTTTRPLATSSTTSVSRFTTTTEPTGTPLTPQEPPVLNPAAPVVGSGADALPDAEAAARQAEAEDDPTPYLVAVGLLVVLAAAGAGSVRRRALRGPRP